MILDKLVSFSEYVRFGAVCKPWQSVLLVPYQKRLSGSSHGWLFTVEETFGITLINPFSGATIELPPIMDLSYFYPPDDDDDDDGGDGDDDGDDDDDNDSIEVDFEVVKTTLSADPALYPNDYIVTATYSGHRRLAFILPGDKAWTYLDKERFQLFYDVVYYKGLIFAVDFRVRVLMIDVNRKDGKSKAPQVKEIAPQTNADSQRTYLVESSSGDLLLVQRFLKVGDDLQHATSGFKVFKLLLEQFEQGQAMRVEVKNLGGDTLFLGDNQSICVSACKWPGCQPDSIYYTDDYIEILARLPHGRRDIGIFNIESGRFGRITSLILHIRICHPQFGLCQLC
ncbi:putative F-box protein At5g55150 [Cornus florida]|uniref:putative F-box protein At5g55150 n=1 Tax=Cornus florida TaxID=4283 RepID=UPI002896748E|nr:putative F-box protein At5g55150 [Cornus florida]